MSAGLELDDTMFSARTVPWHGLGVVTEGVLTAAEAIEAAGLTWTVSKEPIAVIGSSDAIPNRFATVRSDTQKVLGIVGGDYELVQNHTAFGIADDIVDDGDAKYETAGSLWSGRRVFMTMTFPEGIEVGGVDPVNLYLVLTNSHDGSSALKAMVTPVRVVCQNTLNLAVGSARTSWSVRHVSTANAKISEARRALDLTFKYTEDFKEIANELAGEKMVDVDLFLKELLPDKPKTEEVATAIVSLYNESPTLENVRGTRWAMVNAVGEYFSWIRPTKTDETRVVGDWYGVGKKMRDKAVSLLV